MSIRLATIDPFVRPQDGAGTNRLATSEAGGAITFDGLVRGAFVLRSKDDRYASQAILVDTSAGSVEGLVVRTTRGVRVGVEFEPAPQPGARVRVIGSDGAELLVRGVPPTGIVPLHLAPGRYRVELVDVDEAPISTDIVVDERSRTFRVGR
jgi:hypothetical protein